MVVRSVLEQSIKVLDENVNYINLTLIKKYFKKEHGITLKTSLVLKQKMWFMTIACAKLICILKIVLCAMSVSTGTI
jgi:hypothetical protein